MTPDAALCRDDGKISKPLSLQPIGDKGDWFLGLDVKDAANKENSVKLGLPLTGGELHTIKALSEVNVLDSCLSSDSTWNRLHLLRSDVWSSLHPEQAS